MAKTILLAAEKGYLSVQDQIDDGTVELYETPTFKSLQEVLYALWREEIKGDIVAIDALSMLATRTRQDLLLPSDPRAGHDIWAKMLTKTSIVPSQRNYQEMSDGLMRTLLMFMGLPMPLVMTSIERSGEDPMQPDDRKIRRGPDFNAMLLNFVVQQCDVIGRMYITSEAEGGVPIGTRAMLLKGNDRVSAGARSYRGITVPDVLYNPSLPKLAEIYRGHLPHVILAYGPPKVGKTTFQCSYTYNSQPKETAYAASA